MAALYARFTAFEAAFNAQDAIDFTQNHAEIPVRGAFGILSLSPPLRVPFESGLRTHCGTGPRRWVPSTYRLCF